MGSDSTIPLGLESASQGGYNGFSSFFGDGASADGALSRGVFSTTSDAKIGFGATRKTIQKQVMVYAEEQADGSLPIQASTTIMCPRGER